MGRSRIPIYAYEGEVLKYRFSSAQEAAETLGISVSYVRTVVNEMLTCKGLRLTYVKESNAPLIVDTRRIPKTTYKAVIEGRTFESVVVSEFKKCSECDIFKISPPKSMAQYPLCYDYSCGNRSIVHLCEAFRIIWRERK